MKAVMPATSRMVFSVLCLESRRYHHSAAASPSILHDVR